MRMSAENARLTGQMQVRNGVLVMGQDHKNKVVRITMDILANDYLEIREKGWKYKEIMYLGLQAKKNMPVILTRMEELEKGNEKLQQTLSRYWRQMHLKEVKNENI